MRKGSGTRRTAVRRFASVMAAVGALLVSSGIALMAAPTPASAEPDGDAKVAVCKYVGTPGESRLQTGGNPIEVSVNTLKNAFDTKEAFDAWLLDPSFPVAWTDAQGQAGDGSMAIGFIGTQTWTIEDCPGYEPELTEAYADVQWIDPSCGTKAGLETKSGDPVDVTWSAPTPAPAPGVTVSITATAMEGYTFDGSTTKTFSHAYPQVVPPEGQTYDPATGLCTTVSPPVNPPTTPQVSPPKAPVKAHVKAEATTPTVVHAGLAGSTVDSSAQAGLALAAAGLLLLAGAGGLVLVGGGDRR